MYVRADYVGLDMSIRSGSTSLRTMMGLIIHLLWACVVADYDRLDIFISSECMSLLTMMGLICLSPLGVCQ